MRSGLDAEAAAVKAAEEFVEVRDSQQKVEEAARAKTDAKAKASARENRKRLAKEAVDPKERQKTQPEKKRKTAAEGHEDEAVATSKKTKGDPRLTVFVGQLPFTAVASDVEDHFLKAGITSAAVRILTEKGTSKARGIAFVQLISEEDVSTALGLHQSELQGRWINVERSSRKSLYQESSDIGGDAASAQVNPDLSVFVGQLPYSATEESIREHFENSGVKGVSRVKLLSEKVSNKKGMAFVQLCDEDGVRDALKLHESDLGGRRLVVERSSKQEAKQRAAQAVDDEQQPEEQ